MTETLPVLQPIAVAESVDVAEPIAAAEPIVIGSLSPSRASDFKTCPLLYRFRSIDRLPEAPSPAATRGTMVHAVPVWQQMLADEPGLAALFAQDSDGSAVTAWLESSYALVDNYFALEDPTRLEPESREQLVEVVVDGLRLRGYIDRVDVTSTGDIRIVDYKTGSVPREAFEAKALFQMKFYALVLWRLRGVVPRQLKLIYLADCDTLTYAPDATELERFETTLRAIWAAIARASELGEFRPSPSRLCDWCDHQALCPAFGGTPPPFPFERLAAAGSDRRGGSEQVVQEGNVDLVQ
jgi:putative RecB family exonuclease